MPHSEKASTAEEHPFKILVVDNEKRNIDWMTRAMKRRERERTNGLGFPVHVDSILVDTQTQEELCKQIDQYYLDNQDCNFVIAMDRNLEKGRFGENVVAAYKQEYPDAQVTFFAYTTDVDSEEHINRWQDEKSNWLVAGFLPKNIVKLINGTKFQGSLAGVGFDDWNELLLKELTSEEYSALVKRLKNMEGLDLEVSKNLKRGSSSTGSGKDFFSTSSSLSRDGSSNENDSKDSFGRFFTSKSEDVRENNNAHVPVRRVHSDSVLIR